MRFPLAGVLGTPASRLLLLLVWLLGTHLMVAGGTAHADTPTITVCGPSGTIDDILAHSAWDETSPLHGNWCALEDLENTAFKLYAASHGMDPAAPATLSVAQQAGQAEIAGIMWQLLVAYAYDAEDTPSGQPSPLTAEQHGAYDWLSNIVMTVRQDAAQQAINEYQKWYGHQCSYSPPNPPGKTLFQFNPSTDPACLSSLESALSGPTPPTLSDFIAFGNYLASQDYGLNTDVAGSKTLGLSREIIGESQASWAAIFAGGTTPLVDTLVPGSAGLESVTNAVFPYAQSRAFRDIQRAYVRAQARLQNLQDADAEAELAQEGKATDSVLEEGASAADQEVAETGIDVSEAVTEFGADALVGPFMVAGVAASILSQEAIKVIAAAQLPDQLNANLNAVNGQLVPLLSDTTGGGYNAILQDFESQLNLPAPTTAAAPPDDGTRLEVGLVDENQQVRYSSTQQKLQIDAWPLGIDQGVYGGFGQTFTVANGVFWHTPTSDEAAAGLTGWIPSDSLHYYDWTGRPRLAFIHGDHFVVLSSPGSNDLGGNDAGDGCATAGECVVTTSLSLLSQGGIVEPSFTTWDSLGLTKTYQPSDGTLQPDSLPIRYRVSIVPDTGAPANFAAINQYGEVANAGSTPPDGGLASGQTVKLTASNQNPLGFDETYTWQIETRCAYNAAHPPQTIQGVPVCYGGPDYGRSTLGANEQDLTSGCPSACTEDPAFHGHPVATVTGSSVPYTWPGPGTYTVRLITSDAYGQTHAQDQQFTISGVKPTVAYSTSPGFQGVSSFGPVTDGDSVTVTGCIEEPELAYTTPQVQIDWGDGATESQTAPNGDSTLSFHAGATAGCSSPWQFTATHVYTVTQTKQVPVTITVDDGFGASTSVIKSTFGANQVYTAAPAFSSADHATFTIGALGYFTVHATGAPVPTLSIPAGSLPPGISFSSQGPGYASISGTPSAGEAGTHTLDITTESSLGSTVQHFTLTIDDTPQFTNAASTTMTTGHAGGFTFTTSGYPAPHLTLDTVAGPNGATALPADVSFTDNGGGTASLTASNITSTGTYQLTLKAAGNAGVAYQQFTLVLSCAPAFNSPDTAGFVSGGAPTSFTIQADGSPAPAISITGGTLPLGLLFTDNGDGTATISGAVAAGTTGTFPLSLKAENAGGTATQTLTINTSATGGPAITVTGTGTNVITSSFDSILDATAGFTAGSSSAALTISSSDHSDLKLAGGTIPVGLHFTNHGDGTATIDGTPDATSSGGYGLTISTVTGGLAFLSLIVYGPPVFTSPSVATFVTGKKSSFTVTAAGEPHVPFGSGALPSGLTFKDNGDNTATISGTPDTGTAGTYTVDISGENLEGSATQHLKVVVEEAPRITSAAIAGFGEGVTGSFTITTSGSPAPSLSLAGSLPGGLTFQDNGNGTASIAGMPDAGTAGDYGVTVTATSPAGVATTPLTVRVGPPPAITSGSEADFIAGNAGSFTITTTGLPAPSIQATSLPDGLALVDNGDGTATISGTPNAPGGSATVTVTASNIFGSDQQSLTIVVGEAAVWVGTLNGNDCSHTNPTRTDMKFTAGNLNSWTLCGSGYGTPALSISGDLPPGVTFTDNGDGSGTIQGSAAGGTAGSYPLTLTLSNAYGLSTKDLTLTVVEPVSRVSADSPTFVAGQQNTYVMQASGSPLPSFSPQNSSYYPWPAWLSLTDNGDGTATLTGTPPANDPNLLSNGITVRVMETNGVSNGLLEDVDINVTPLAFTAVSPPTGRTGLPYRYAFAAQTDGSNADLTYTLHAGDSLPSGLTLSATGLLSGTTMQVGTWQFRVDVTDGTNTTTSRPIALSITPSAHQLEVDEFRVVGHTGSGDWFALLYNPGSSTLPLDGWKLKMAAAGSTSPVQVSLGTGSIAGHGTYTVSGPYLSLANPVPNQVVNLLAADPGGFAVVAPDGTVTDRAGEVGAPAALTSGTGVSYPSLTAATGTNPQHAFLRVMNGGQPQNTDANSTDFTFAPASSGPTRALLERASVVRRQTATMIRWTVVGNRGIVGFRLTAAGAPLTRLLIPVHRSLNYRITEPRRITAPVTLRIVLARGGQERVRLR